MSAPTSPSDAALAFNRVFGDILGCITETRILFPRDVEPSQKAYPLEFKEAIPTKLTMDDRTKPALHFGFRHEFKILRDDDSGMPRYRISTVQYEYSVLDELDRELLVFHWQRNPPLTSGLKSLPHLHVNANVVHRSARGDETVIGMDKRHIPTGRVSLESVVRMLIEEFDVKPIHKKWSNVLVKTAAEFERRRSDPHSR